MEHLPTIEEVMEIRVDRFPRGYLIRIIHACGLATLERTTAQDTQDWVSTHFPGVLVRWDTNMLA